jgi:release factor glutamine methyltransferase
MQNFKTYAKNKLSPKFQNSEINQITRQLLEKYAGVDSLEFYSGKDKKINAENSAKLEDAVRRLLSDEPLQYVLGETQFSGITLNIKPGALIPRPETEEMTQMAITDLAKLNLNNLNIIDYCTGSGCIAISLSKNLPGSKVYAFDISEDALAIAKENTVHNNVDVELKIKDLLKDNSEEFAPQSIDLIISNPPYVCENEKEDIEPRVLDYEPHTALFVEDEDPLIFYRKIGQTAEILLKPGGILYFEINSKLFKETLDLISGFSFRESMLIKDLSGKYRFIKATK